jgi:hypothetical protein
LNYHKAKAIILNAVEITKPRWSQYDESWKNIDDIFIYRGYEQQGFQLFKMRPVLEKLNIFSIDKLGTILSEYPFPKNYSRDFACNLTSPFYSDLEKGVCDHVGESFVEAVRIFLDEKIGNPRRTFWKLLYQMLQGCAYLKQNYSSSYGKYILSKYASHNNREYVSENDFLKTTVSDWEYFLTKARPWSDLVGIGPDVFDFMLGDIVEAKFSKNSYKFDSSNEHFLIVTGISKLIVPLNRDATSNFLNGLGLAFSLREINKGIYTYCSRTESDKYGYCRDLSKCFDCNVNNICEKEIRPLMVVKGVEMDSPRTNNLGNTKSMITEKGNVTRSLPRLIDATTFSDLSSIIRLRSIRYPTNFIDLLLLENDNYKLSEILTIYQKYESKNNDFKLISRILVLIKFRENQYGWIYKYSGNQDDPIVKLIGLK